MKPIPIELTFESTIKRDRVYNDMIEDPDRPEALEIWKDGEFKIKGEIIIRGR